MDFNSSDIRTIFLVIATIILTIVLLTGLILIILGIKNKKRRFWIPGLIIFLIPSFIILYTYSNYKPVNVRRTNSYSQKRKPNHNKSEDNLSLVEYEKKGIKFEKYIRTEIKGKLQQIKVFTTNNLDGKTFRVKDLLNSCASFANSDIKSPLTKEECNTLVVLTNIKSKECFGIYKLSLYSKEENFITSMKSVCKKDSYIRTGKYKGMYEIIFKFSLSLRISNTKTVVLEKL